jgi:AraC family transcriptional regulator
MRVEVNAIESGTEARVSVLYQPALMMALRTGSIELGLRRSARLRRIKELVDAKIEDELTLCEMAQAVELSPAHFSRMFRKSTGETPHRFLLRQRLERAKMMLRSADGRVMDVGFRSQQHFAQAFRQVCGASPTEYRQECLDHETTYSRER